MENIWKKHEEWVEKNIINSADKYIWIHKNPQSGFTTSLGKVCIKNGLKFFEVAPYNRIIDDTIAIKVMEGKPYCRISSNKEMCKNNFPNPYFIGDNEGNHKIYHCNCKSCSFIQTELCEYYRVSHTEYPAGGITYAKLDNILRHPSRMGNCRNDILKIIFEDSNIILLDEFINLITWLPKGFWLEDLAGIVIEINKGLKNIDSKNYDKNLELIEVLNRFVDGITKVEINEERHGIKCGIYQNEPLKFFGHEDINITDIGVLGRKVIKNIVNTTFKALKVLEYDNDDVINTVKDALLCMLESEIIIHEKICKIENSKTGEKTEVVKRFVLPNMTHPFEVIEPYLKEFTERGGKIVATGMLIPTFETLPFKELTMPDFNDNEKTHLILCDTKNMGFYRTKINEKCTLDDWRTEENRIRDFLLQLKDRFRSEKIIVFCFNKDIHARLDIWRNEKIIEKPELKDVILNKDFCLTYYGSEFNSGTALDYRIKVYIGGAQTPNDAFEDAKLLYGLPHDKMRDMDIAHRLVNALGRGKDPEGKEPSISIVIGCKMNDTITIKENGEEKTVKGLVNLMKGTMYYDKKEITQTVTQGTIYCTCNILGYWWFGGENVIKDIHTLPWLIDALRITTVRWKNHKGFITKYKQIYEHWKRKSNFEGGVDTVKNILWSNFNLMPTFIKLETSGLKVVGTKANNFANDLLMCNNTDVINES